MTVEPTTHSFSLRRHFARKPGFDCVAYADLAAELGFKGISLSLNTTIAGALEGARVGASTVCGAIWMALGSVLRLMHRARILPV